MFCAGNGSAAGLKTAFSIASMDLLPTMGLTLYVYIDIKLFIAAERHTFCTTDSQAGRRAGRQAGRQAGRH